MKDYSRGDTCTTSIRYCSEHGSVGERSVLKDVYYGVQSLRAAENPPVTGLAVHPEQINSIAETKKASAATNPEIGLPDKWMADAIVWVCSEIVTGRLYEAFIVDPIQGDAGTSLNMNANEVIANRAIELPGGEKGDCALVNPSDRANYGQSVNDALPSVGKLAVLKLLVRAQIQLERLSEVLEAKAEEFDDVPKMGHTQMQDAMPIRLGQEFRAYSWVVCRGIVRFERIKDETRCLSTGGTAIGAGTSADERYLRRIILNLSKVTGLELVQAFDLIDATQNLDRLAAMPGAVKTCAVNLFKMSNDLRLMSSGPRCGFGEINLPPRQNGSPTMPGKVNPVIPEAVSQMAFNITGNDVIATMATEAGQLELNAFEPIIFYNLIQSVETLTYAVYTFVDNCATGTIANRERCRDMVEYSVGTITVLCPHMGYEKAAEVVKQAIKTDAPVWRLILEEGLLDEAALGKTLDPYSMTEPSISGKGLLEG